MESAALHGILQLMSSLQRRGVVDERDLRQIGAVMDEAATYAGSAEEQGRVQLLIKGAIDEIVSSPPQRPRPA
jgi:hypothetical protein